jgi:hypothetical protein
VRPDAAADRFVLFVERHVRAPRREVSRGDETGEPAANDH